MTKEELIKKYCEYQDKIKELEEKKQNTIAELAKMTEHKVGEIVKWKETNRKKNIGTTWRPNYVPLPDKDRVAVLADIDASVWSNTRVSYCYHFRPITKAGELSKKECYVPKDVVWTGEIHEDYKDK